MEQAREEGLTSDLKLERETLIEAVRTIVSTLDLDTVLQRLLYLTHRILGFDYCTILLIGEDAKTMEVAARHGYPLSIIHGVELSVGRGITGRVAQTGEPAIVPDVSKEERYLEGLRGARSELVVPLKFRERVLGVLDIQSPKLDAFCERDVEILSALGSVASTAIINARNHAEALRSRDEASRRRALERQINLARTFQEWMLPRRDPMVAGFEIAGVNLPGETLSGDYYDYVPLPHGHLGVAVADVSGEGLPAALLAASVQGTMRAHIEDLYSIASIVTRTNESLHALTRPEDFATLFYAVFDPDGTVTYVNAGHNPPLVFRENGRVERLWDGGTVLGVFPGLRYDQGRIGTRPGDCLVMYTDGLTEAFRGEEPFGEERVIETVLRAHGAPARVVATMLVTEADSFSGPGASPDDMTVVVARRLEPGRTG